MHLLLAIVTDKKSMFDMDSGLSGGIPWWQMLLLLPTKSWSIVILWAAKNVVGNQILFHMSGLSL